MPLYEYICKKCGHRFEFLVVGPAQPACPLCRSTELEQMYSSFATSSQHKGNGGSFATPVRNGCSGGSGGG